MFNLLVSWLLYIYIIKIHNYQTQCNHMTWPPWSSSLNPHWTIRACHHATMYAMSPANCTIQSLTHGTCWYYDFTILSFPCQHMNVDYTCYVIVWMTHGTFLFVHMDPWKCKKWVTRRSLSCCHVTLLTSPWHHPVTCKDRPRGNLLWLLSCLTKTLTDHNFFIRNPFEAIFSPLERYRQNLWNEFILKIIWEIQILSISWSFWSSVSVSDPIGSLWAFLDHSQGIPRDNTQE